MSKVTPFEKQLPPAAAAHPPQDWRWFYSLLASYELQHHMEAPPLSPNGCHKALCALTSPDIPDAIAKNRRAHHQTSLNTIPAALHCLIPLLAWNVCLRWEICSQSSVGDFHTSYKLVNRVQTLPAATGMRHFWASFLTLPPSPLCSFFSECCTAWWKQRSIQRKSLSFKETMMGLLWTCAL